MKTIRFVSPRGVLLVTTLLGLLLLLSLHASNMTVIVHDNAGADRILVAKLKPQDVISTHKSALKHRRENLHSIKHNTLSAQHTRQIMQDSEEKIQSFQALQDHKVLLYSAHHDERHNHVKIVGLGPMQNETIIGQILCKLTYADQSQSESVLGIHYHISTFFPWEHQEYDSYLYFCDIDGKLGRPTKVTLIDQFLSVTLSITQPQSRTQKEFAVCVEPLFDYTDTDTLLHHISVNSIFGAEHFYFYNISSGAEVSKVLNHPHMKDMVTVYQWPLGNDRIKTHANAQKAAYAHCLYNHRLVANYLVYIDLDELLVPRRSATWKNMIEQAWSSSNITDAKLGAVVFRSKVFPRQVNTSETADSYAVKHNLWSLTKLKGTEPYNFGHWSKVVVSTAGADVMDIHIVRRLQQGFNKVEATPEIGLIHHYRNQAEDQNHPVTVDDYMRMFMRNIPKKVQQLRSLIGLPG